MQPYTVQPFLVMLFVGIAAMGLPIYQVCRREVGTLRIDAHRIKPSAWRAVFRRVLAGWRQMFVRLLPAMAVLALLLVVAYQTDASAETGGAVLMAATPLNIALDRKAELKTEALKLLETPAKDRTPEQVARLDAIETEVVALDKDIALLRRLQEDERRAAAESVAVEVGLDRASLRPWGREIPANASDRTRESMRMEAFGEFLQAVANASMPGGRVDPRLRAEISGASTSVPADGGHLVRTEFSTVLLERAQEQAVLAPRCTPLPVGDDFDGVELPYIDETSRATGSRWGGVRVYRAAEADAVTASKPKLGREEIRLEDLNALMYATDRTLRDARALAAVATRAFASEYAFVIDDEIIRGAGGGQCLGLLNSNALVTVTKETGQPADTVVTANISKMWMRLHPRQKAGAIWIYNHELGPQFDELSIPAGTAALEPRVVTYGPDGLLRIKGRPAIEVEQCSAIGDVGDLMVVNFAEYLLAAKDGIQQAESMHVRFIYNERTFRWTYRINGQPSWRTTVTPYKGTSGHTLSPYVTLGAR